MKTGTKFGLGVLGGVFLLFVFFVAILSFMFAPENWDKRRARFERAAETGMTLVRAIEEFSTKHGAPPPSLDALVPQHLPLIPETGLPDYPSFEYEVFTNTRVSLAWYDLGDRNGKPMAGLWIYNEGDADHAILALTLDQNDRVVAARVDRMPEEHQQIAFDTNKWHQNDSRIEMVRSLPEHVSIEGSFLSELLPVLGEPTGISTVRNTPWELRIECSQGILNWDVFFYWPTQDYLDYVYGGYTELIGNWAYVHE